MKVKLGKLPVMTGKRQGSCTGIDDSLGGGAELRGTIVDDIEWCVGTQVEVERRQMAEISAIRAKIDGTLRRQCRSFEDFDKSANLS